jgi:hypothetical protein
MPRDYLEEASDVIFGNTVSLAELLESEPEMVMEGLLQAIEKAHAERERNPMHAMIRKAAVYALGQIGDPRLLEILREFYNDHREVAGVKEAMVASMTAIKLAPTPKHSQLERRQLIEDVYNNRRPADWS